MSNIRDREIFAAQLWDWAFLNDALTDEHGGRARPADADGLIEQWRHLLMLEGKPKGFRWIPTSGQRRALQVFASRPGQITICMYGSNPTDPIVDEIECCINEIWTPREKMTTNEAQELVKSWFSHARSGCSATACTLEVQRGEVPVHEPEEPER